MAEEHIKINPVPTKVKYSGNGVVREFPTGFAFFEDDNIVVYHNGVIISTGYSVTGVSETDGGVVTFDVAPAEGDKIVIIRRVAIERVTDFQEGGAFRAKNINDELDRQTAFCQQIQEEIDRCVKVEVTDDQTPEELLAEVYGKLDSATEVAQNAVDAATAATEAVASAEKTLAEVTTYVDESKAEIGALITKTTEEIDQTISDATEEIKEVAVNAANEAVQETIGASVIEAATSAENARIWAEGEQAEVEPLGGELSSKGWALQASNSATSASQSAAQAKTSETNAKSYADSIEPDRFLNKEMITNCITEIPQDIKLELNNGVLTLKAGSKVYVPNGFEADGVTPKFDVVILTNDLTASDSLNSSVFIYVVHTSTTPQLFVATPAQTSSGSGTGNGYYYSTDNNRIYVNKDDLSASLPIGLSTSGSSGGYTSIDQVLNGFGYIGSTVFALPGVKGLIPNGRNADGSLRNVEFTVQQVLTHTSTISLTYESIPFIIQKGNVIGYNGLYKYDDIDNVIYDGEQIREQFVCGYVKLTNSVISNFTPKLPFHAVDYQEVEDIVNNLTKHVVVSAVPAKPDTDVFYYIPE